MRSKARIQSPRPAEPRRAVAGTVAAIPWAVSIAALAALPAVFNVASVRVFEEEKALLLRAAALLAVPGAVAAVRWRQRALLGDLTVRTVLVFVGWIAATTLVLSPTRDALLGAYQKSHGVAMWLALASVFVTMCHVATGARGSHWLFRAVMVGSVWPASYLLLQHAGVDPVHWIAPTAGFMAGSTFGNHVYVGGYLAMVIPLTIAEAMRTRGWFLLTLLQLAAVILAGSRGAWLACAGGLAVFGLVYLRGRLPRFVPAAVAGLAAVLILVALLVPAFRPITLDPATGSARVRVLIWQGTAGLLRDSGWRIWLGHGQESLRALFPRYYVAEIGRLEGTDAMPDRAHNELLDTLVTSGIVGTILELVMFASAVGTALRVREPRLGAALAGVIVAHFVEIQFGVATVTTRLTFLAATAVAVGQRQGRPATEPRPAGAPTGLKRPALDDERAPAADGVMKWVVLTAVAGAASPALWLLPGTPGSLPARGTISEFVDYLHALSDGTVLVYVSLIALSIVIAGRIAATVHASDPLPPIATAAWLIAAIAVAVPTAITPSRADIVARAATGFEQQRQWQESAVAFEEARRLEPAVAAYADGMGRALSQGAIGLQGEPRARSIGRAREAFETAIRLAPYDADYGRHFASLLRIAAWNASPEEHDRLLQEADGIYGDATARAPQLTGLWVEWARVDLDRQRTDAALEKLDRALVLQPENSEAGSARARLTSTAGPAR